MICLSSIVSEIQGFIGRKYPLFPVLLTLVSFEALARSFLCDFDITNLETLRHPIQQTADRHATYDYAAL